MAKGRVYLRGKTWYLDVYTGRVIDGEYERIRVRTDAKNKKSAEDLLAAEVYKYSRMVMTGDVPDNKYLIRSLYDDWKTNVELHNVNGKTQYLLLRYALRFIEALEQLGIYSVDLIRLKDVDTVMRIISDELSNETTNKSLQYFRSMLEYGVTRNLIHSNPVKGVKKLPEKRVKFRRALTAEEARLLIEEAPAYWSLIWRMYLCTGLRSDELMSLEWRNVDFDACTLFVRQSKTKAGIRTIPLVPGVVKALQNLERRSGYVFATQDGRKRENNVLRELRRHFKRVLYKTRGVPLKHLSADEHKEFDGVIAEIQADLKLVDIHALRYTFCTHLIGQGVDIKTVQRLMGHSSIEVTLRVYAQYCHGNAEDAITRLPWDV